MLSDFDSSLSELSTDEEEYVPVPKKRKVAVKKNEYTIRSALKPPRTTQYTTKSLYDMMHDNTVELDPEYQRDVVWPESKQSGLIDSVLRNYYIPPIIFAVTYHDDGSSTRVCIDGKQRLTSIQRFMDGLISHKDAITNKRYWFKDGPGTKRVVLSRQIVLAFSLKQITCVEYDNLNDDQEREIFQRVQLGVALTPAERMQAFSGPWPTLIRDIQTRILGHDGFGEDLDWGRTRGRDFQCLASIVYLIHTHPNVKFPGTSALDKWLQSTSPVPAKFREEVLDSFRIFVTLVKDKRYNAAFQKPTRVSPIEFTMIGILIHHFRTTLSMMQLSSAIWKLRGDVRSRHTDIRANTKVTKTMFNFIFKGMKTADLTNDGKGDMPAAEVKAAATEVARKPKRKRVYSSSDEESDEPLRKVSAPKPSTSRTVVLATAAAAKASEPPKVVNSRVTLERKTIAKKVSTSKAATSTSPTITKSSAKQSPVEPPARPPAVAASSSLRQSTNSSSPRVSSTPQAATKRATAASKPINSPTVASPSVPPTPQPPAKSLAPAAKPKPPPAIPRRSTQQAVVKISPGPDPPIPPSPQTTVAVKTEPMADARTTFDAPAFVPVAGPTTGPVDRLAALRAAKAGVSRARAPRSATAATGPSTPWGPAPVSSASQSHDIPNVLDGLPPLRSRQSRSQLPSIDTDVGGPQPSQPREPRTAPPSSTPATIPQGQSVPHAAVEELLRHFGLAAQQGRPTSSLVSASPQTPAGPPSDAITNAGSVAPQFGASAAVSTRPPASRGSPPDVTRNQTAGLGISAPPSALVQQSNAVSMPAPAALSGPLLLHQSTNVSSAAAKAAAPLGPQQNGQSFPSQANGLNSPVLQRSGPIPHSPALPPKPPISTPFSLQKPHAVTAAPMGAGAESPRTPISAPAAPGRRDDYVGGAYTGRNYRERTLSGDLDRTRNREYDGDRNRERDSGWGGRRSWDRRGSGGLSRGSSKGGS